MDFRDYQTADYREILKLRRDYFEIISEPQPQKIREEELKKAVEDENQNIIVAANPRLLGFTWLVKENQNTYFKMIHVKENHQGKGIGEKLIKKGIKWGSKKDCKTFTLHVKPGNKPAEKLYEKIGFTHHRNYLKLEAK